MKKKAFLLFISALTILVLPGCSSTPAPASYSSYRQPPPKKKVISSRPAPTRVSSKTSHKTTPKTSKKGRPYTVLGKTYHPVTSHQNWDETGTASWYGKKFHGKRTASGEVYNMYQLSAAHKILPLHTQVEVTNLGNGRSVIVRINDRGPFVKNRIIDMSYAAARELEMVGSGTARVHVRALGNLKGDLPGTYFIQAGSFTIRSNAVRLREKLRQTGYPDSRIVRAVVDGKELWRVQAGSFTTYNQALEIRKKLEDRYAGCFILAD